MIMKLKSQTVVKCLIKLPKPQGDQQMSFLVWSALQTELI